MADSRARIADARLYLCTDGRLDRDDLPAFLDAVLAGGVDVVQLRHKALEAARELELLAVFAAACERHGKLFAVNDRADVAYGSGAPILHLGQDDLPVGIARRIVGQETLIGRSTHAEAEVEAAAADPETGYFAVGPCWPTPTKPGRPAPGLGLVRHAARVAPPGADGVPPWFAIGGVDERNLDEVLDAGARRIVVVRALTAAPDAAAAGAMARSLSARLRSVPLAD
ncbi:thiamine phosphate synthase [Actinospica sp.]|uniref:thiamine phosphate synthase n=1 Tax=Actinospica sp. TaxID=1872142 RepID=UPI002C4B5430|nr:thiamine phosphate synthase [Actinospica sp.]HWG22828.1 thiamine phosphate synthase [Actinospica sp.]